MDLTRKGSERPVRGHRSLSGEALTEPATITRNGCERLAVSSLEEYARLKRRDRSVHDVADLSDTTLDAIERSEMDPRHDHLDSLLGDWTR